MADSPTKNVLAELQKQYAVAHDPQIAEQLSSEINKNETSIRRRLIKENPFYEHQDKLTVAQESLKQGLYDLPLIQSDLESYKELKTLAKEEIEDFWSKRICEFSDKNKDIKQLQETEEQLSKLGKVKKTAQSDRQKLEEKKEAFRGALQNEWQKLLDKECTRWELAAIAEYRRQLFARLEEWLKLMQELADAMHALSIEPGLLFDLSADNLSVNDIEQIKRWAKYLAEDEGVKRLCELLGRMRVAARAKRQEWITITETFAEVRPDIHAREEIIGICTGNNIEHTLPQEKALLADEDTALLFDLKFAENRLIQFDMSGHTIAEETREKKELTEVSEEEKMGPIIVCVDTSGSMNGQPETIAKAVALYMATTALRQKRDCLLINFSTGIETLDVSGVNFAEMIKFLQQSFNGGTDIKPAIDCALSTMKKENYRESDLLVVSDFMMNELPKTLHPKILNAKENGNKFHSLAIGNMFLNTTLKNLFNNEWVYNPESSGIRRLLDIADAIDDSAG